MKTLTSLAMLVLSCIAVYSAPEKAASFPPHAARDAVDGACQKARQDSKLVFMKSGFPACGWCRVFDRYHDSPETKEILEKYYVIIKIDTENMPDGKAVFSQFAEPGAPSWVIVTPDRKKVIDSYDSTGNVGYPSAPNEIAYYLKALKKATPQITQAELDKLAVLLKKAEGKK